MISRHFQLNKSHVKVKLSKLHVSNGWFKSVALDVHPMNSI